MRARAVVAIALAAAVCLVGVAAGATAVRAAGYPGYWQRLADAPVAPGAVRIVALGDSSMTAVGAMDPGRGIAGRLAGLAAEITGRPVHLANRAVGGATVADVLAGQIDEADLARADLVIVSTTNDLQQGVPLVDYRAGLDELFARLPADRVVMSDLLPMPGRDPYQAVLREVALAHGVALAPASAVFARDGRRLDVFSFLPPHLNDVGYGLWAVAFEASARRILAS